MSLRTGLPPKIVKRVVPDVFFSNITTLGHALISGLGLIDVIIDQVTLKDESIVDSARSICGGLEIKYVRVNPNLKMDVALNETSDEILIIMLSETRVHIVAMYSELEAMAERLMQNRSTQL